MSRVGVEVGVVFFVLSNIFQAIEKWVSYEGGVDESLAEPLLLEWQYAAELIAALSQFPDTPWRPGP